MILARFSPRGAISGRPDQPRRCGAAAALWAWGSAGCSPIRHAPAVTRAAERLCSERGQRLESRRDRCCGCRQSAPQPAAPAGRRGRRGWAVGRAVGRAVPALRTVGAPPSGLPCIPIVEFQEHRIPDHRNCQAVFTLDSSRHFCWEKTGSPAGRSFAPLLGLPVELPRRK